jgi:hypothetical protein
VQPRSSSPAFPAAERLWRTVNRHRCQPGLLIGRRGTKKACAQPAAARKTGIAGAVIHLCAGRPAQPATLPATLPATAAVVAPSIVATAAGRTKSSLPGGRRRTCTRTSAGTGTCTGTRTDTSTTAASASGATATSGRTPSSRGRAPGAHDLGRRGRRQREERLGDIQVPGVGRGPGRAARLKRRLRLARGVHAVHRRGHAQLTGPAPQCDRLLPRQRRADAGKPLAAAYLVVGAQQQGRNTM